MKKKLFSFYISPEVKVRLEAEAKHRHSSVSFVINSYINKGLDRDDEAKRIAAFTSNDSVFDVKEDFFSCKN